MLVKIKKKINRIKARIKYRKEQWDKFWWYFTLDREAYGELKQKFWTWLLIRYRPSAGRVFPWFLRKTSHKVFIRILDTYKHIFRKALQLDGYPLINLIDSGAISYVNWDLTDKELCDWYVAWVSLMLIEAYQEKHYVRLLRLMFHLPYRHDQMIPFADTDDKARRIRYYLINDLLYKRSKTVIAQIWVEKAESEKRDRVKHEKGA